MRRNGVEERNGSKGGSMNRFYGFDLGDAESAVSRLEKKDQGVPEVLSINGEKSFVTAYASLRSGELLIGEKACYNAGAMKRRLRFKSRFLTDPSSLADLKSFAAGVLGELYASGDLIKDDDCCFYIGCPAGWNMSARERYRELFEKTGYPPVRIISESRAALVSACQSKHLQIGVDILSRPVLVVDIGSSTTDFAYIMSGKEVEMKTAGEVMLGGGLMDEMLLSESVDASPDAAKLKKVFSESEPWRSYCEFAARRLKEKYFSDEEYWKENGCEQTMLVRYDEPLRLTLRMDGVMANRLINKRIEKLHGRSFHDVFEKSLMEVRDNISSKQPELLFLTGGVSKLEAVRDWCQAVFPDAVVITGAEPEFSVSRGLAWSGRIDDELRDFRRELGELTASSVIEDIVEEHIDELYHCTVDALVDPIMENVALPVFEKWRSGEIRRLEDTDAKMEKAIEAYLHSEEAREVLHKQIASWMKPIADKLEDYTLPICIRHNVPFTALSLNSYLSASDIDIRLDAKNVFAVEEITWMIDSIVSILIGLICGGSEIALLSGGPSGMIAGAAVSLLVLFLGKDKMQEALLKADLPKVIRKLVPRNAFRSRIHSIGEDVKDDFFSNLDSGKTEAITDRMVSEISDQIERCLIKMAEVVEIPLG
jgi:cell division ATPase FtsA